MIRKIKIAIAEDDLVYRSLASSYIDSQSDMQVIIETSNGKKLIKEIQNEKPDVVLLDLIMPVMDGITTTKYLHQHHSDIKILILTAHSDEKTSADLLLYGAHGFSKKNKDLSHIIKDIHMIRDGHYVLKDWSLQQILISHQPKRESVAKDDIYFSEKELKILELVCKQYASKEISEALHMSKRTVEWYKTNLLQKTNLKNSVGLALYAVKNGLISSDGNI